MFLENQNHLIDTVKLLLFQQDESIYELLDFENDQIFMEPMLFAYFNNANGEEIDLQQILYGYIEPDKRPSEVDVRSNGSGVVYLPNFSYLISDTEDASLVLKTSGDKLTLWHGGEGVDFTQEPLAYASDSAIEIITHDIPLIHQFFKTFSGNPVSQPNIEVTTSRHRSELEIALDFIATHRSDMHARVGSTTRKVILFDSQDTNSFASLSVHGVAFFNVNRANLDHVFFIYDISHQCGHVYFNVETFEKSEYFLVPPDTALNEISLHCTTEDVRPVYVVFHAMYTYTQILKSLDKYFSAGVGTDRQRREAIGRICFYINKLDDDIKNLDISGDRGDNLVFSEQGMKYFRQFISVYDIYEKKWRNIFSKVDLYNQPYNFDIDFFEAANRGDAGIPRSTISEISV